MTGGSLQRRDQVDQLRGMTQSDLQLDLETRCEIFHLEQDVTC